MHAAGTLQEMDDLVFSDADANLNLTAMLSPLFNKVGALCPKPFNLPPPP
jgi:hypothetical protein